MQSIFKTIANHSVNFCLLGLLLILTGCNTPSRPAPTSIIEVTGTTARRIEVISAMLRDFHEPPTPLLDAHFVQEQIGDDMLGPADYRGFMHLQIAPENVAAWQALLTPLDHAPTYAAPSQSTSWWVDEEAFAKLRFYAPDPLTGRTNGWIALDTATGTLYLYSFTT